MSEPFLYDEVPYPGRAFVQSHPDRMATMATLFGLDAAPPAACRVLELGCGDGGNLLPMALALPGSSFTGIDLSAHAIAQAQSRTTELGLDNIRFERRGFDDYEPPPGSFDYVIAHGIYSWVPPAVRDRLMALCARALAERGVAYVSYNALPGHRNRQTLRDLLTLELEGIDEPRARMAAARRLLAEACEVWRAGEGQEATLGGQAKMLLEQSDALFFHDTLSPHNKAPYFVEFAAHAGAHGLQFLAEAEFTEMQTGGLPDAMRARVHAIDDVVRREQLLDFLKQRMFRQTLLCHGAVTLDHVPRPERIAGMAAAGPVKSEVDEATGRVTFRGPAGARLTTDHPPLIAALRRIGERWPGAARITDLAEAGPDADADAPAGESLEMLCKALLPCFAANVVRLHVHPPAAATAPGPFPRTTALAKLQARERGFVTTLRHTSGRPEDEIGWQLIGLLDGTRDRAALLTALAATLDGDHPDLADEIERGLVTLARAGLLLPDA
jgi:SAM-dependent methyltransferase